MKEKRNLQFDRRGSNSAGLDLKFHSFDYIISICNSVKRLFRSGLEMLKLFPSSNIYSLVQGADKFLARPTSRCILFDGENISFDASPVIYIYIYTVLIFLQL